MILHVSAHLALVGVLAAFFYFNDGMYFIFNHACSLDVADVFETVRAVIFIDCVVVLAFITSE